MDSSVTHTAAPYSNSARSAFAFSSQYVIPISWYIVVAVAECSSARYLAEQVCYLYGPSARVVAAWESYVRNFAPNLGNDYGGRLMAAWLDR